MQRCLAYSKPFLRWPARVSQSLKSQTPQAFRPSCSSMWRLSVWTSWLAIWPPASRPPTKARQPILSLSTRAGDSREPEPLSRVTGSSQRRMSAADSVSAHKPPIGRGLGDHRVAGQELDQHGVHQHAQRVVPGGDVGHRAGQRLAAGQHRFDLLQVPAHPRDGAVHRGQRLAPGLADLPHQQQGEQLPVGLQLLHAPGDAGPPLLQVDSCPSPVLGVRGGHGLQRVLQPEHRWPSDRLAVDGAGRLGRVASRVPCTVPQVADPIRARMLPVRPRGSARRRPPNAPRSGRAGELQSASWTQVTSGPGRPRRSGRRPGPAGPLGPRRWAGGCGR